MRFNPGVVGKVISMAKSVKNPKAMIDMALSELSKKNPKAASLIRNAIACGRNPKEFILEQAQSGNISMNNLNTLKQYYEFAQQLGLKQTVPDNIWREAEEAIRQGEQKTSQLPATINNSKFAGF